MLNTVTDYSPLNKIHDSLLIQTNKQTNEGEEKALPNTTMPSNTWRRNGIRKSPLITIRIIVDLDKHHQ